MSDFLLYRHTGRVTRAAVRPRRASLLPLPLLLNHHQRAGRSLLDPSTTGRGGPHRPGEQRHRQGEERTDRETDA